MAPNLQEADYNEIADRVYIEGWALALTFGAVDQGVQHNWWPAAVCAVLSAFCQFVVIRWSAWIKARPGNPIFVSVNKVATNAVWWVATGMVFLGYLALSPYVEQQRWPFAWFWASSAQPSTSQTEAPPSEITLSTRPAQIPLSDDEKQFRHDLRIFVRSTLSEQMGSFWQLAFQTVKNNTLSGNQKEINDAAAELFDRSCNFRMNDYYANLDKETQVNISNIAVNNVIPHLTEYISAYSDCESYFLDAVIVSGDLKVSKDLLSRWITAESRTDSALSDLKASPLANNVGLSRINSPSITPASNRLRTYLLERVR